MEAYQPRCATHSGGLRRFDMLHDWSRRNLVTLTKVFCPKQASGHTSTATDG